LGVGKGGAVMTTPFGPQLKISQILHANKHRGKGESFDDSMVRISNPLADNEGHFRSLLSILRYMFFLFGGRIQAAIGAARRITPFNCFVSGIIPDSMDGIMDKAKEAAQTMRLGGGIGYDFSTLRPRGALITTLDSTSCGPVPFMKIYDATCGTISSAGHRRGAQMAVLRVDHPDIEEFIRCKQNESEFRNFNISVGITDEFMEAVLYDLEFSLHFEGKVYRKISARALWEEIMRSNWDWAEPGVLFLDRINVMNNLYYLELITTTNPCAEQPLPPYGACLLGSFNLTKYIIRNSDNEFVFDWKKFETDIPVVVRGMDNIIDQAYYPLPEQEAEGRNKRRIGLGIMGLANAVEALGHSYGSAGFLDITRKIMTTLRDQAYAASIELAKEKGPFSLFDADSYCNSKFIATLPQNLQDDIREFGIRNSHLISIAPTGTTAITADNVSGGIEPVFEYSYDRDIQTPEGPLKAKMVDYGYRVFGIKGKTASQCSVDDHLKVLLAVQPFVDSSVAKTCNVGDQVGWDEFKSIYWRAWEGGAKGCTTFRPAGKRFGILNKNQDESCSIDPQTGIKSCEMEAGL
jgi:ribonucleoside-diphosphate reductase alpha chain